MLNRILLAFILLLFVTTVPALAKAETFDIAIFTAPTGWKKDTKQGIASFSKIKGNGYCVIAAYASRPNTGNDIRLPEGA